MATATVTSTTLLAVDGNSLYHRAYHAYAPRDGAAPLVDSNGRPAWALVGFFSLLSGLLEKIKPGALVVGFDDSSRSVRTERYPEYKATRPDREPELRIQLARTRALVSDLGISCVVAPGLEADDVMASASSLATAAGWNCVIATSDRDSFSLISDSTRVLRIHSGGLKQAEMLTPAAIVANVGVKPEQYLHYAALRGDKSDNLPGVSGIGEKTAAKLLGAFPDVEAAFAELTSGGEQVIAAIGRAMSKRLDSEEAREAFRLNVEMMRLDSGVGFDLDATRIPVTVDIDEVMRRHGMPSNPRLASLLLAQAQATPAPAHKQIAAPVSASVVATPQHEGERGAPRSGPFLTPNPRPAQRSLLTG